VDSRHFWSPIVHPSLRLVERFDELLTRQDSQLPYDFSSLFPDGGYWTRRASQRKLAFLKKVDEAIRAMLRPDERVMYLTQAVAYSFWESYFGGLPMYYLNRRAIVLTTERVILMQIDSRRRPRALRSEVALGAIEGFRRTALGNMALRLASGTRQVFVHMPRRDRKNLVAQTMAARAKAGAAAERRLVHLCPHCYRVVDGFPSDCPSCKRALKSWRTAGRLSLLFPGLGNIYLGQPRFAVLEVLVAGLFWLSILLAIVFPDPRAPMRAGELATSAFLGFLIFHGGDALATFHIAKKGHYPAVRAPAPTAAPASTAAQGNAPPGVK
jgi:hypothetical protein